MKFKLKGRMIFFVTNNIHKFNEARRVLDEYNISVGMLKIQKIEIQNRSLREIAEKGVEEAFKMCNLPIIVEDAGLFVESLKGFPGPYSSYVYETLGNKGMLKLMETVKTRKAKFSSVIAYHSEKLDSPKCFKGQIRGTITEGERKGKNGDSFGFDPIFKPVTSEQTFAEMDMKEKNQFSHRAQAVRKFSEWYKKQA